MSRGIAKYDPSALLGFPFQMLAHLPGVPANGASQAFLYPGANLEPNNRNHVFRVSDLAVHNTVAGSGGTVVFEFHKTNQAGADLGKIGSITIAGSARYGQQDIRVNQRGIALLAGEGIRIDVSGVGATPGTNWNIVVNGVAFSASA